MANKLISVIIPAYNLGNHIIRTLESLVKQDLAEMEIIIVDDGSKDNTTDITVNFLNEYNEAEYRVIRKINGGVSSARNRGIEEAQGEYVYFLDGDDYVSDDFVVSLKEFVKKDDSDILCWGYDKVSIEKKPLDSYFKQYQRKYFSGTGVEVLYSIIVDKNISIWTCSAIYKRNFLMENDLKYSEGCVAGEDLEFTFNSLMKAQRVKFINKVLSFYVQREGSISNRYDIRKFDSIGAMYRVYQNMIKEIDPKFKVISKEFKNRQILVHYFYNLHMCFKYSKDRNIKNLLREIDELYPDLNGAMISIMKSQKNISTKQGIKINMFLMSPKIYFELYKQKLKLE